MGVSGGTQGNLNFCQSRVGKRIRVLNIAYSFLRTSGPLSGERPPGALRSRSKRYLKPLFFSTNVIGVTGLSSPVMGRGGGGELGGMGKKEGIWEVKK